MSEKRWGTKSQWGVIKMEKKSGGCDFEEILFMESVVLF